MLVINNNGPEDADCFYKGQYYKVSRNKVFVHRGGEWVFTNGITVDQIDREIHKQEIEEITKPKSEVYVMNGTPEKKTCDKCKTYPANHEVYKWWETPTKQDLCCRCHIEDGGDPAGWHSGCMRIAKEKGLI